MVRTTGQALIRRSFRRTIHRGRYDLYHEPNFIPLPGDLPTLATVHDLSALLYPHWHPAVRVAHFEKHFHRGLRRCCHLFAISAFGKREIVEHLGWPAERVTVTYMGVRPGLRRLDAAELRRGLQQLGLPEGYLLHVGTLEPRKNLLMLMRAYCSLPGELRRRHPLVLAGGPGWNSADIHDYLEREGKHRGVRWLGYVGEQHFAALYTAARALVFPTLYEGFGMPPVEMMACGGAVIASTAGAVAETAGRQAHLVDPLDADGWREAMRRVCTDEDWWQSLRQGAEEAAAAFTWERCAADTLIAYRQVLAGEHRQAA
jgi:alpha-1,3-rhamnosyl/mannosyltransferase